MYPRAGALDTLVLEATGRVGRLTAGIDDIGVPLTRWYIGSPYSPGGLCFATDTTGATPRGGTCQAFLVRGDTLWLANGVQAAFLRAGAGQPRQTVAWDRLHGHADGTDPLTIGRDSVAGRGR